MGTIDITLIRTFIAVADTGSFVAACDRLFVTQSAVSLRIQRLEDSLGHPLFTRSKAGAILTPQGVQFERYALSLLKIWAEARQHIAIPEGYTRALTIGAQYALWPRLGFRWIDQLQNAMPELSLHSEMGTPDRLTRFLVEGLVQAALMYTPQQRPGLILERALEDDLIMVASYTRATAEQADDYVFVDWGPEFTHAHATALPHLANAGLSMTLGALAADYIMNRRAKAYLPTRAVQQRLDAGKLHIVTNAPRFSYPAWVVWRDDLDSDLLAIGRAALANVVQEAERDKKSVSAQLERINHVKNDEDE